MRDALSPSCVTQKMAERDPEDFTRPFCFRVTHDGLSERGITRSLKGPLQPVVVVVFQFVYKAVCLPFMNMDYKGEVFTVARYDVVNLLTFCDTDL